VKDGEIWKVAVNSKDKYFIVCGRELFAIEHAVGQGSSLIGNQLVSSTNIYIISPFDSLFLLIPKLASEARFRDMPDILQESHLEFLSNIQIDFSQICDIKIHDQNPHLRINADKVNIWLKSKIDSLQKTALEKLPWISQSSNSELNSYKFALAIIGQYLPFSFIQNMESRFTFEALLNVGRIARRSDLEENNASLKQKSGNFAGKKAKKPVKNEVKLARGQQTLNFFKK
jgi:hypothetical protein